MMTPVEAARWATTELTNTFPLGVFRDGHGLELGHPRYRSAPPLETIPDLLLAEGDHADLVLPDHDFSIDEARFKIAGFGGQGVILLGKILAHAGMLARRQVSWLPSYGPEMRGGTANCGVALSDDEIGSPLIQHPTHLVAMNGPSVERFGPEVVPGGVILFNSSIIESEPARTDVTKIAVPAKEIAQRIGEPKVANMVMLGAVLGYGCGLSREAILSALPAVAKAHGELLELNIEAIDLGFAAVQRTSGQQPDASAGHDSSAGERPIGGE
jgi:Pyruvate/2-oxoacid:ferredoxin oxidoreductase gamma subunit